MSIMANVVDASDELQRQGIEPGELYEALQYSLYLTLGGAQLDAGLRNQTSVDAITLKRAGVRFFSLGWPFCCADE